METQAASMPKKRKGLLGRLERFAGTVCAMTYSMAFGCIDNAMMYFYTDILRIGTSLSGTLNLIFSAWDAINDPMLANYIDNHTSKKGYRVKHIFLYCAAPFMVFLVLCFTAPDWSIGAKFAFALVARCVFDVLDTLCMTSYDTMKIICSPDKQDRVSMTESFTLGSIIGTGVSAVVFWVLVDVIGGLRPINGVPDEKLGILGTVCVFAALAAGGLVFYHFNAKERVALPNTKDSADKVTFVDSLKLLTPNKHWQKIMLFRLFAIVSNILVATGLAYYCKYVLGDTSYVSVAYIFYLVGGLIALPFGKPLSKRLGSKGLALACAAAYILSKVIFVFDSASLVMLCINTAILGVAGTFGDFAYSLYNAQLGDIVAYQQRRRCDAMIVGLGVFFRRLASALAIFVMTQVLAFFKYNGALAVQPVEAVEAIKTFMGWVPMATGAVVLVLALLINVEKSANEVYALQAKE